MQIRNLGSIGTKPMIVNLIGSFLTNIPEYIDKRIFAILRILLHTIMSLCTWHSYIWLSRLYFTHHEKVYCWFEIEAFASHKFILAKYSGIFVNDATSTQTLFIMEDPKRNREFLFEQYIPISYERLLCILKDYFNFLSSDFSQTNKVWSVMLFSTPLAKATRVSCAENRSKPIAICRPMLRFVTCLYIAPCSWLFVHFASHLLLVNICQNVWSTYQILRVSKNWNFPAFLYWMLPLFRPIPFIFQNTSHRWAPCMKTEGLLYMSALWIMPQTSLMWSSSS